ncbi:Glucan endo-1,3-beta-glucosidase 7 [Acorus calamus]|uniref:glucan endo-1,3-beta-D-glucosidase n=1 Tax=Acorus calamus TaxID=4465 RepID=A0AAV9CWU4_ACOCL|nr:Glucan endo-1,3-beta-glucosidase 7 [Acorus calamus]
MAEENPKLSPSLLLFAALQLFFFFFFSASSQSFIGVNYGEVADNLPPPSTTANLLQSTSISKVRLYGADPAILRALSGTGVGVFIGVSNGEIPSLASDPAVANRWIASNVLPFLPSTNILLISVGNEVLTSGDPTLPSQLLPAMQNLHSALLSVPGADQIKISTVHSMAVLGQSEPPSSGAFQASLADTLKGLLGFLESTGSPFAVNPYPYFAYGSDTRPETLAFCLFQPNQGRFDPGSRITYMNMFDAQVDAVRSALNGLGGKDVEIVVAETGWPYKGDPNEVGATVENAKAYNGGLVSHLRSMVGTPLMPGKSVDTYFFALYDEDLKPGPASERSFGLYRLDGTMNYDIGLARSVQAVPAGPSLPSSAKKPTGYCVPRPGVSDAQLQANLDYACAQGIDCTQIQPGGSCYLPNTVASHAAYAMNLFYQKSAKNPGNCDFRQTAALVLGNPSAWVDCLVHCALCGACQTLLHGVLLMCAVAAYI